MRLLRRGATQYSNVGITSSSSLNEQVTFLRAFSIFNSVCSKSNVSLTQTNKHFFSNVTLCKGLGSPFFNQLT